MTSDKTQKISSKPTLDAPGFQRLLAAAYILQSRIDPTAVCLISVPDTNAFATTAIIQKRTPAIRPSLGRSGAMREADTVPKLTGLMFWKRVEAFAISVVLCLMMVMSIHRLLASRGRASPDQEALETSDATRLASPAPKVLAPSQQPAAARESRQWHDDGAADDFSDDLVIHHRVLAKLIANKVVQYGDDVTMWSSGESSSAQSSPGQSRKSFLNRESSGLSGRGRPPLMANCILKATGSKSCR